VTRIPNLGNDNRGVTICEMQNVKKCVYRFQGHSLSLGVFWRRSLDAWPTLSAFRETTASQYVAFGALPMNLILSFRSAVRTSLQGRYCGVKVKPHDGDESHTLVLHVLQRESAGVFGSFRAD